MNGLHNNLLIDLPAELQYQLTEYLTIEDLSVCSRVCRTWRALFDSDVMWEMTAKRLKIKKIEVDSYFHSLIKNVPFICNWLPNNNYKYLVQQKFLLEVEEIQNQFPEEFLEVFGGAKAIQRLPYVEITIDDMIMEQGVMRRFYYFKDEHFSSPMTRTMVNGQPFILFRIRNNETGEVYRNAVSFFSVGGDAASFFFVARLRCFNIDNTRYNQRVICQCYARVSMDKLNRLQRLIQRQPVGLINKEDSYYIVEGPKITHDNKSVLELC